MKTALLSVECKQLRCTGGITWSHVLSSSNFDRCWVSLPSSSFSCSAQNVNLLVTTPLAMLLISGWPGVTGCASFEKRALNYSVARFDGHCKQSEKGMNHVAFLGGIPILRRSQCLTTTIILHTAEVWRKDVQNRLSLSLSHWQSHSQLCDGSALMLISIFLHKCQEDIHQDTKNDQPHSWSCICKTNQLLLC